MRRVWFRSPLLVLAFVLAGAGVAEASAVCTRLKAQLASVSTKDGSSANFRRYAEAVTKQGQQIRQVRADLGRFGCTSGSFIVRGGKNAKACAKLTAAHTKMRANIRALERKRDSYSRNDRNTARRRIQAALQANDCDGKRASIQAAALKGENDRKRAKSPGLVAVLGNSGGDTVKASNQARTRIQVEPRASRSGNYRTLCVRSCDGFFFPVSSSASPSDFARDERTCQMMCPGTKTALYFHAANGQESEEMVSARSHAPYTDMPNAFAYRTAKAPMSKACSCNMGAFFKEMARREAILNGTAEPDAPVTTWVRPFNRPDPGEDPETVLDTEMRLTSEDVAAVIAASRTEHPLTDERRQVRMVGPTFLPDQAGHLDLNAGSDWAVR
ncbi:DUF2865 domain-containing protein [Hoeflea sp. Naph1]|uniref:DUF2865 domain-containing protein n=1 Tax=Hoeflea sp. Naph1 TaxID=3388653 RepID=UPI00398FA5FA